MRGSYFKICTRHTSDGETFDETEHICETKEEVVKYLAETYPNIKPHAWREYNAYNGIEEVVALSYWFDNSDVSHAPIVKWKQVDWVFVYVVCEVEVKPDILKIDYDEQEAEN